MLQKSYTDIFTDILVNVKNNMSLKTTTGIVAIGAGSNVNIRSSAEMKIKSGGEYKLQVSWCCANETFDSTYRVKYKALNEFDHDGDRRIMVGADDYARHKTGVNFTWTMFMMIHLEQVRMIALIQQHQHYRRRNEWLILLHQIYVEQVNSLINLLDNFLASKTHFKDS